MWYRMPYHKRFSSPVTAEQAEEALAIGYWIRASLDDTAITAIKLCQRHVNFLLLLNAREKQVQIINPVPPSPPAPTLTRSLATLTTPVTNGNLSTSPPPVPIVEQPAMATVIAPIDPIPTTEPKIEKRSYRCPVCHKVAILGDVHLCE